MNMFSAPVASLVQRFEELRQEFDHRDVFTSDVNAVRARSLALAEGDHDVRGGRGTSRLAATPNPDNVSHNKTATSAHARPSVRRTRHGVSSHHHGASGAMDGGKGVSHLSSLQTLQQRLQDVEAAASVAQVKGISVEAEIKQRALDAAHAAALKESSGTAAAATAATSGGASGTTGHGRRNHPLRQLRDHGGAGAGGGRKPQHLSAGPTGPPHLAGQPASAAQHLRKHAQPSQVASGPTPTGYRRREGASSSDDDDGDNDAGGSKRRLSHSVNDSSSLLADRVPAPVERGGLAPSEWFQRSAEHLDYPDVEDQLRARLKRKDEAVRGTSPVDRYTKPFSAHLSEKDRLWRESSAKVTVAIVAPDPKTLLQQGQHTRQPASPLEADECKDSGAARGGRQQGRASSPIQKRQPAASGPLATTAQQAQQGPGKPSDNNVPVDSNDQDVFEAMQDRVKFLHMARSSRKARKIYQDSVAKELLAAAGMLSAHVPLFANEPNRRKRQQGYPAMANETETYDVVRGGDGAPRDDANVGDGGGVGGKVDDDGSASISSSNSGDVDEDPREFAEREGLRYVGDGSTALLVPGIRLPAPDPKTDDLTDVCELIECTVVCLCSQLGTTGSVTREQVILRTILIHALHSGLPVLEDELSRRRAFVNKTVSAPPAQGPLQTALISRLLRSWTKAVEVLLSMDINTVAEDHVPFTIHNEHHLRNLVAYYCNLHEAKEARVQRLFDRWRANKEEADSAIIKNDTSRLLVPLPANQTKAAELVAHFQSVASITTEDMALLDHQAQKVASKQQELAQAFLTRVSKFLPGAEGPKTMAEHRRHEAEIITEGDLLLHRSPPNLRHVLLHYAGLLQHTPARPRSPSHSAIPSPVADTSTHGVSGDAKSKEMQRQSSSLAAVATVSTQPSMGSPALATTSESFTFQADSVTPVGINKFLNVFRSTWGRTPLSGDVSKDEATDRAETMQNGTLILLLDAYFHLLSPLLQDRIRLLIRDEKKRMAALKAKMKSDSDALRSALGAFGSLAGGGANDDHKAKIREEAQRALQEVERYQLIDKYTVKKTDPVLADKLRKSVESSDSWFAYEHSRRAARLAAGNQIGDDGTVDGRGGANDGSSGDAASLSASPARSVQSSRMEMIRLRKLQELEASWHKLGMGYSLRISLHDKWNHPTKEIRHIEVALKLYRECIVAVEAREAAYHAVLDNEKKPKAVKMANRSALFNTMCTTGQKCELLAKKLLADCGDELYYKNDIYVAKLRDDFARISQLLRTG